MGLLSFAAALLLQQDPDTAAAEAAAAAAAAGMGMGVLLFYLLIIVISIAGMWAMFTKAGHPGWMAIVPFLNAYILLQIARRPGWWLILLLIPIVSLIIWIVVAFDIARLFGRGAGTAIGLILLPFVFMPILGFGSAQYEG
jgi:hypothetical protein